MRNVEAHALQTGKEMGLVGVHLADYVTKSLDRYVEMNKASDKKFADEKRERELQSAYMLTKTDSSCCLQ